MSPPAPGPPPAAVGPLHGITVIECASIVLGPLAAQYLGDMGADVIKVEPPEGDRTRQIGPRRTKDMGAFFLSNNRNKRSLVLDLKVPQGLDVLHRLIERSDVLLHSIRTPAAERLGLGYGDLSAANPKLIHCHVKGFGEAGPYGGRPAYDDIVQALSGLAMAQTVVTGQPRYLPTLLADKVTAVHAALAISFALLYRERTGVGQQVDVAMFETMASFNVSEHLWGQCFSPPIGQMGYESVITAARRPFPTLDGYLSFLPYSDREWHRFFELIERADIMEDPRFATFEARQQNMKLVWDEIDAQLALRTTEEWMALLGEEDLPLAVVNSFEDLLSDPHLVETEFWKLLDDPDGGQLRFPGSPFAFSASPASLRRLPPRLGAHTDEILREFGLHDCDIDALVAARATLPAPGSDATSVEEFVDT